MYPQRSRKRVGRMRNLGTAALILLASISMGCPTRDQEIDASMAAEAVEAPWSVAYRDGSGNGFRFWRESEGEDARFEYAPVTPETSSSGIYSGGEPNEGPIFRGQFPWRSLEQALLRSEVTR